MWNWGAFALEFAGSAILLFVAMGVVNGGMAASGVWSSGGGIWLPFFVGTAVIASMALFFLSFSNLCGSCSCGCGCGCGCGGGRKAKVAAVAAGVTLVALTVGQAQLMMLVLLGFALAFIGTIVSSGSCTCEMAEPPSKPKSRK